MSVIAPSPPEREVPAAPEGERTPEQPPVFELLIASRPERERRAVAWAVAAAVGAHLLLILLFIWLGPLGGKWRGLLPQTVGTEDHPIAILLPSSIGGAPARPPAPAVSNTGEERLVTPTHIPRGIPAVPAPGAGQGQDNGQGVKGNAAGAGAAPQPGGGGGFSAAEALKPHSWDRRLWEPPEALLPDQSDADRVADRVQRKLDVVNDSMAAVAAAERKGKDWTIKDKNGNAWGIGPDGKLVLGGLKLPIPLPSGQFVAPPGRRDEFRKDQANWEAIQRSASQAEIRHTFDERVKAIRERKEKEHQDEQQKKDETATTSSTP